METDRLQNIWKNNDTRIKLKTINELNQSLAARSKQRLNKFRIFFVIDAFVCVGVIAFLIITALNRQGDPLYQANNAVLSLFTLISLVISLMSWNRLHNNKFNLPLKEWVEERIRLLSKWLLGKYSKLYVVLIPILLVMINISIHVYYENKPLAEVLKSEESVIGLILGFIIGVFVSFYAINKIRRYQIKNLGYLKEIHAQLCNDTL
jgi:Na+/melibiose symporter-like transporter